MLTNQQAGICILCLGMIFCAAAVLIWRWEKGRQKKYTETVDGVVVSHKWRRMENFSYPCAVVAYLVDGVSYHCIQTYAGVYTNSIKHAEYDWEIDKNYYLHSYVTSRCRNHVNPITDWFPVGSGMKVHYISGKPQKAYCGALRSMKLLWVILLAAGAGIGLFGLLLALLA